MADPINQLPGDDSKILGVSVRAWLAVLLTYTVCIMSGYGVKIDEPLYSGFLMGLGFFLGQKSK